MPVDPFLKKQFVHLEGISSFFDVFSDPLLFAAANRFKEDPGPWEMPRLIVTDEEVPGPHGLVRIRRYQPSGITSDCLPRLVWLHGGGFAHGDLDMNEAHMVAAELAARTPAVVVSVDYRLAVGDVFHPVPLDDVEAVWLHEAAHVQDRLCIGGASAGASLSAGLVHRSLSNGQRCPDGLMLAYPLLHFPVPSLVPDFAAELAREMPPLLRFAPDHIEGMMRNYTGRTSDLSAEAAPGHGDLTRFPPTAILTSEYDDLRPSGELFARQLREAGVHVRERLACGMIHGHLDRTPSLTEVNASLNFLAAALREK